MGRRLSGQCHILFDSDAIPSSPWGGQSWPRPPFQAAETRATLAATARVRSRHAESVRHVRLQNVQNFRQPAAGRIARPTVQKVCGIGLSGCKKREVRNAESYAVPSRESTPFAPPRSLPPSLPGPQTVHCRGLRSRQNEFLFVGGQRSAAPPRRPTKHRPDPIQLGFLRCKTILTSAMCSRPRNPKTEAQIASASHNNPRLCELSGGSSGRLVSAWPLVAPQTRL